jgi:hypothetical protein
MFASLMLLLGLGCMLLWILAWQRGSRLAVGIAIGAALVLIGVPLVRAMSALDHVPIWGPPLPFALVALTLFGFGLLAWFWGEE